MSEWERKKGQLLLVSERTHGLVGIRISSNKFVSGNWICIKVYLLGFPCLL